jgi:hypothetical protein
MRRKDPARLSRNILWRGRAMTLALVSTGLVTALAAAQMATKPDDAAMSRAITKQQVSAAQVPSAPHDRGRAMNPDEMLEASEAYEGEIKTTLEHAETLRIAAYRSKDIIRMTCVDDKVGQLKQIFNIAKPRFETIKQVTSDEFHMRAQFTTIREGTERIRQVAAELETCTGDSLEYVGAARINEEAHGPGVIEGDSTLPPNPTTIEIERPSQASPYY